MRFEEQVRVQIRKRFDRATEQARGHDDIPGKT
jgi:hypothetical protein